MASKIWSYIEKDDTRAINMLGKKSFNEVRFNGETPLLSAIKNKSWNMFTAILENGGDPFYESKFNTTPLGLLIRGGHDTFAELIYEKYLQAGKSIPSGPLVEAVFNQREEWVKRFIENDIALKIEERPELPAHSIITDGKWLDFERDHSLIPDILSDRRRFFAPVSYQMLDYMALGMPKEQQEWFYSKGVPKLEEIPNDWLVIYQQVALNRKDSVRGQILFDHGNQISRGKGKELWAIHCFWEAISNQQWDFAEHIKENTKNDFNIVNAKRKYTQSEIFWGREQKAEEREAHPIFKIIYKLGMLESGEDRSRTPLSPEKKQEWVEKYQDAIKRLLEWGVDPNLKEEGWGLPLVHLAARANSKSALSILAEAGADFNSRTGAKSRGKTVLAMLNHQKKYELASFVEGLLLKQKVGYNELSKTKTLSAL